MLGVCSTRYTDVARRLNMYNINTNQQMPRAAAAAAAADDDDLPIMSRGLAKLIPTLYAILPNAT